MTMVYILDKPEWFRQPGYIERLAEIISKSTQLEVVRINYCKTDGSMMAPILAALKSSVQTIKEIILPATNWNE